MARLAVSPKQSSQDAASTFSAGNRTFHVLDKKLCLLTGEADPKLKSLLAGQ
jgi:hypothetical protein